MGGGGGERAEEGEVVAEEDAAGLELLGGRGRGRNGARLLRLHGVTDRRLDGMSLYRTMRAGVYRFGERLFSNPMMNQAINFAMLSHPGRVRKGNEDTCAGDVATGAFVVCDGNGWGGGG